MQWVYLDNNATTQPATQVVQAMHQANEQWWANPSSVHRFGQMVRQRVELARAGLASLIHAKDRQIVFTSGGAESNNLALKGTLAEALRNHASDVALVTTKIEHSAIREPANELAEAGATVTYLPVSIDGIIDPAHLADTLRELEQAGKSLVLVSIQWANNETGVIQPMSELLAAVQQFRTSQTSRMRIVMHSDATQAVGKIPVDITQVPVDLLTFAPHKFHGPKGVGVLYVRNGVRLYPQQRGGPQERERRGGTENTVGIIGAGIAAELAKAFLQDHAAIDRLRCLRGRFEQTLVQILPDTVVNSGQAQRLWNTTNLAFPRLEAEAILIGLSEQGVCASAGAACSSGSLEPSPVLLAMGIDEPIAHGSVRFSLGRFTTDVDIDRALQVVPSVVQRLARTLPISST